jgi:guanylate kinase
LNNKKSLGKLIVIVAPSGTGKSTMIKRLKNDFSSIVESVSFTTRSIRKGEVEGVSYFFISREKFLIMIAEEKFLEWAEVHGNFYGTSKEFVEDSLRAGKNLLFDPSIDELEKRLRNRGTESTQIINLRLENAKEELLRKNDFDFLIYNDDIEKAYKRLCEITREIIER